jgi:uncharacterized protein YbjT (DUF2867 family)
MIVVTAATGQIGNALVEELLNRKQKVRALARDEKKLAPLAAKGAETRAVDLTDAAAVAESFRGASSAFLLIPPRYNAPEFRHYYNQVSGVYASAVRAAGVKRVVNLSSLGAHLPDGTGPIKGLYDHERRLDGLADVHRLHLRPAYFMENAYFGLGLIKNQGIYGSPVAPGIRFPMIATRDIARRAAQALTEANFSGRSVLELHGERDLSLAEVTRALGAAIGKPDLPYVQFPYQDAFNAMVNMGLSPDVAALFNEMYKAFNEGTLKPTQARSAATTTPTSIEEFAKGFAAAYKAL